jgi:hypothetical protein
MARSFTAIPGVVLLICLVLPAMRVCGHPELPIEFPPCYAAYLGGIGVIIMALARGRRGLIVGASLPPTLAILTLGGWFALATKSPAAPVVGLATVWLAVMAPFAIARRPVTSERLMACMALLQGLGSTAWAALIATDKDAMWGADVTLAAGIALIIGAVAWLDVATCTPELPRATLLE